MADDILVVLDKCLERIRRGETVEQCLADYPELRPQLESLLRTFRSVSTVRRVAPSGQFKQAAYTRLMSQIRADSKQPERHFLNIFDFNNLRHNLAFKVLAPVALVIIAALVVWMTLPAFSPGGITDDEFTLSLLNGEAEIKKANSTTWLIGTDGMRLKEGDRVRTPVNSFALLTFFDGSTTKLEPGAEVLIVRSEYVDQKYAQIELQQQSGKTWTYVAGGNAAPTQFALNTPQSQATAELTAFSTEIDRTTTRFTVAEGSLQVIKGDQQTQVSAAKQIDVRDQVALSPPLPIPASENELVISTAPAGIGSVRDPNGASTGYFPDGLAFNQITNSKSVVSTSAQQITIGEPVSGEYLLAVRRTSGNDIPVNIQAKQGGKVVLEYNTVLPANTETGWIIHFKVEDGNLANGVKEVSIEPLADAVPENVIETDLAKKRITPIAIARAQTTIPGSTTTRPGGSSLPSTSPEPGQTSKPGVTSSTPTVEITVPTITSTVISPNTTTPVVPEVIAPVVDTTAPEVISNNPSRDAIVVGIEKEITAKFSEKMDSATINNGTFTVLEGSTAINGTVSYIDSTRTAIFKPENKLVFSTIYTAIISREVSDQAGNPLSEDYFWSFTTVAKPDTDPPRIRLVSPADNAANLSANTVITAIFNEAMNERSVLDLKNFRLTADNTTLKCTATYSSQTNTLTLIPEGGLPYGALYKATLSTGYQDAAGNHLAKSFSWSFSTGTAQPVAIISIEAPETAQTGSWLDVNVDVSKVTNLAAFELDLEFNHNVLQILDGDSGVTAGRINGDILDYYTIKRSFVQDNPDHLRILGAIKVPGVSGSGYIVQLHFKVIGEAGSASTLTLSQTNRGLTTVDILFDNNSKPISSSFINGLVIVEP
jgi:hypothetical protein